MMLCILTMYLYISQNQSKRHLIYGSLDWDCGWHVVVDTMYTDNVSLSFPESEPSELMNKPWFIGVLIGTVGACCG